MLELHPSLTATEKAALRSYLASCKHRFAAQVLGLARNTIYRALKGEEPLRPGSVLQIRAGLAAQSEPTP
ncbi:MAG: hypothetical protein WBP56_14510 [Polyangia bacterium]